MKKLIRYLGEKNFLKWSLPLTDDTVEETEKGAQVEGEGESRVQNITKE